MRTIKDIADEAKILAPILRGMCEGGGPEEGTDIYADDYFAADGDDFVIRAAQLLEHLGDLLQAEQPAPALTDSQVIDEMLRHGFTYCYVLSALTKHFVGGIDEARAILQAAQPVQQQCEVNKFSSRVCEQGTKSCVMEHAAQSVQPEGMPISQEPKYGIRDNRLYNRASGEFIPADEPVFVLRAKDSQAASTIFNYAGDFAWNQNTSHYDAVMSRFNDFKRFLQNNPKRVKYPDTVL